MTDPLVTPLERLERVRALVTERAHEGQDYYVALRKEGGALKVGFASMEFAERTGCLSSALYYEVWNPKGECIKAVVVNHKRLSELGGYDLPLHQQLHMKATPELYDANGKFTIRPLGEFIKEQVRDYNLQLHKVALQGENAVPLWWEVERAEKARKLDELVNMRRELRAMLNYD